MSMLLMVCRAKLVAQSAIMSMLWIDAGSLPVKLMVPMAYT